MRLNSIALILVLISALTFAACDKGNLFSLAPGNYRGTLLAKRSNRVRQSLVSTVITATSKTELSVKVTSADSGSSTAIVLKAEAGNKISVLLPDWGNSVVVFKSASQDCFSSVAGNSSLTGTFCFNGTDLTLDLTQGPALDAFTLSVSRADANLPPVYERPQAYSVSELMKRSMNQNFDSPIQFERIVQAKLKTETAYLNLLPHISTNDVLNIAALNLLGYLKAVGDIVPFLFPARWMEARASHYKSEAEFDAWILTKADAANVTEGLAYSVLRDNLVISIAISDRKKIEVDRDKVRERERAGLMQAGASDDVQSILNSIDAGNSALQGTLVQEKIALSQAAGFYNFAAVLDVVPTEDVPIDNLEPFDNASIERLRAIGQDRSYERRQLNALIAASRLTAKESYFQWLDPAGDRDGELGFDLVTYVKIGKSQTQELIDKRIKIETGLGDTIARTASFANQYLDSYHLALSDLAVQNRRVERHEKNLETGINFSMSDLTNALQARLKAEIVLVNAQYGYCLAMANLNRALLSGPYALLPTDRGEPSWIISATAPLN